jgi:hypothetical protein
VVLLNSRATREGGKSTRHFLLASFSFPPNNSKQESDIAFSLSHLLHLLVFPCSESIVVHKVGQDYLKFILYYFKVLSPSEVNL